MYIVDVKRLYTTMKKIVDDSISIVDISRNLGLNLNKPEEAVQHTSPATSYQGWCAGNESRLARRLEKNHVLTTSAE